MCILAAVAVTASFASWEVDWPPSPSRGLAFSSSAPVPDLAALASYKWNTTTAANQAEGSSSWGEEEQGEAAGTIEVLPTHQPPRRVAHLRGGSGYVDPQFDAPGWWSLKLPPPSIPKGVEIDWISTRPRMFLWRGFASRTNVLQVKRLCLSTEMDQYHRWDRHRDQWRIPIGTVPLLDAWTQTAQALWPQLKYKRTFVTVMRSPPGGVGVEEHYDNHVASALLYLSDGGDSGGMGTDEGGWTSFPLNGMYFAQGAVTKTTKAKVLRRHETIPDSLQPRCSQGLQIPPQEGTLLGFYNYYPNSSMDLSSGHASCPIAHKDKWVVVWFFSPHPEKYFGQELEPV